MEGTEMDALLPPNQLPSRKRVRSRKPSDSVYLDFQYGKEDLERLEAVDKDYSRDWICSIPDEFRSFNDHNTELMLNYLAPYLLPAYTGSLPPKLLNEDSEFEYLEYMGPKELLYWREYLDDYETNGKLTDEKREEKITEFERHHSDILKIARKERTDDEENRVKRMKLDKEELEVQKQLEKEAEEEKELKMKERKEKKRIQKQAYLQKQREKKAEALRMQKEEQGRNCDGDIIMKEPTTTMSKMQTIIVDETLQMLPPRSSSFTTMPQESKEVFLPPRIIKAFQHPASPGERGTKNQLKPSLVNRDHNDYTSKGEVSILEGMGTIRNGIIENSTERVGGLFENMRENEEHRVDRQGVAQRLPVSTKERPGNVRLVTLCGGTNVTIASDRTIGRNLSHVMKSPADHPSPTDNKIREILNRVAPIVAPVGYSEPSRYVKPTNCFSPGGRGTKNQFNPSSRPVATSSMRGTISANRTSKVVQIPPSAGALPSISNILGNRPTHHPSEPQGEELMDDIIMEDYEHYSPPMESNEDLSVYHPTEEERHSTVFYTPPEEANTPLNASLRGLIDHSYYNTNGAGFVSI